MWNVITNPSIYYLFMAHMWKAMRKKQFCTYGNKICLKTSYLINILAPRQNCWYLEEPLWKGQECLTKVAKLGPFPCTILYKSCLFYPSWQATPFERPPSWVAFIEGFHCIFNSCLQSWGKIMISMYRLWLHGLYGLHVVHCLRKAVKLNHSLTCWSLFVTVQSLKCHCWFWQCLEILNRCKIIFRMNVPKISPYYKNDSILDNLKQQ